MALNHLPHNFLNTTVPCELMVCAPFSSVKSGAKERGCVAFLRVSLASLLQSRLLQTWPRLAGVTSYAPMSEITRAYLSPPLDGNPHRGDLFESGPSALTRRGCRAADAFDEG